MNSGQHQENQFMIMSLMSSFTQAANVRKRSEYKQQHYMVDNWTYLC